MGFRRSPPPFLSIASTIHRRITRGSKGANFASGGSGILDSTGNTISFSSQILNFATLRSNMTALLPEIQADQLLFRSIFVISAGGNDIFDYFTQSNDRNATENEMFTAALVSTLKHHIEKLYYMGARKFGIIDVPPIGCCPFPRSLTPSGGCLDALNEVSLQFNKDVKALMHDLSSALKGMKYSIGSSYEVVSAIIRDPEALGIKETKTACCGGGRFNGESACTPNATFCSERNRYLFWDRLHPTHAVSKLAGLAIFAGSKQFASPINFRMLVEDDY